LRRIVGTAEWVLGHHERARRNFEILKGTRISLAWAEDAALRLQVMDEKDSFALVPYFTGAVPDSEAVTFLRGLRSRYAVRESTMRYLLGLSYDRQQSRDSALMEYSRARFSDPVLEFSRIRRIALAEFAAGKYQKAKMHFWEARNHVPSGVLELNLDEWIRRCDWMTQKIRYDPYTRTRGQRASGEDKLIFAQNCCLLPSLTSPTKTIRGVSYDNDYRSLGA
ncbi:MAG: hypothetical protein IH628_16440, partial [Proteobacteria bacterium]|nr:hypothetical protein [Pseudomonadota bacterium]